VSPVALRLPRGNWTYLEDDRLGPAGGFGTVYAGAGAAGEPVAVKLLHEELAEDAHRELAIAELLVGRELEHVLGILDAGFDEGIRRFAVVMPRAERSLADELAAHGGALPAADVVPTLADIARGLQEIGELVHRDLKPGNVLRHDGRWKLADFGIARMVEAATSARTLREALSPPYAAPEQWRLERATPATDVYALGCIACELASGRPPFTGSPEDLREQHLSAAPEIPAVVPPALQGLVGAMLRKAPATRPGADRVLETLGRVAVERGPGRTQLIAAAARATSTQARGEAARTAAVRAARARKRLAIAGTRELEAHRDRLYARIAEDVPSAQIRWLGSRSGPDETWNWRALFLPGAAVSIHIDDPHIPHDFRESRPWVVDAVGRGFAVRFDVLARGSVEVVQLSAPVTSVRRILTYSRPDRDSTVRWREHPEGSSDVLSGDPPTVDDEDFDDFCERWSALLASALDGTLARADGAVALGVRPHWAR
jgi:serine/threonine-protein kinase